MKVIRRTVLSNGMTDFAFLGICVLEVPPRPHLVVMEGDRLAELYRFQLHGGLAAVVLNAAQSTDHLPGFMSVQECLDALRATERQRQAQPQHA